MCDSDDDINLWLDLEEGEISQEEFEREMYGVKTCEDNWGDSFGDPCEEIAWEQQLEFQACVRELERINNMNFDELAEEFTAKLYRETTLDAIRWSIVSNDESETINLCIEKTIARKSLKEDTDSDLENIIDNLLMFKIDLKQQSLTVYLIAKHSDKSYNNTKKQLTLPDIDSVKVVSLAVQNHDNEALDIIYAGGKDEDIESLLKEIFRQLQGRIMNNTNRKYVIEYLSDDYTKHVEKKNNPLDYFGPQVPDEEIPF